MNEPSGVPLPVRTSLTPPDRVYVTDTCADTCEDTCTDQVQNIYTEVPPEWPPLPPVPPHQYPNMPKPPPSCDTLVGDHCVEMSHEELERQVWTNLYITSWIIVLLNWKQCSILIYRVQKIIFFSKMFNFQNLREKCSMDVERRLGFTLSSNIFFSTR